MKHIFRGSSQIARGEALATLDGVTKSFGGKPIIDDINMQVNKGDFIVVTGPSGSGKSTVLRTIAGLERPDQGTVNLYGNDLYKMRESKRSQLIAKHVGVGFQAHNLDTGLSLRDNLESLAEARGTVDYSRMGNLIVALGLQDKVSSKESVSSLSGGEKQRVALGRLLLSSPGLVLLDEPTAAIDPHGKALIYDTLREMNEAEDTTFVVVSHDTVARQYATREIVVDSGQIVGDYPFSPTPHPYTPAA